MRDIKFRAWDEQNKIMHNEVEFIRSGTDRNDWILFKSDKQKLEHSNVLNNPYFQQQIKIMQFTRLKDKNKIEIYTKDIIRDGGRLWIVEISSLYGVVLRLLKDKKITRPYVKFEKHLIDDFEVIGNIYENPELLKDIK